MEKGKEKKELTLDFSKIKSLVIENNKSTKTLKGYYIVDLKDIIKQPKDIAELKALVPNDMYLSSTIKGINRRAIEKMEILTSNYLWELEQQKNDETYEIEKRVNKFAGATNFKKDFEKGKIWNSKVSLKQYLVIGDY